MKNIKKFTIHGERCSGTNFLEQAILENFEIELTWEHGSKHFFCFNEYNKRDYDDTLYIGIIRNPIYWLNSFSKELHHVPNVNKKCLQNFLFNKFYSVNDEIHPEPKMNSYFFKMSVPKINNINLYDLNYTNNLKYNNVFELRKLKNKYLMEIMPTKVKNYILINYENLLFNYQETLDLIKTKYNLKAKYTLYKEIKVYKKSDKYNFVKQREITFTPEIVDILWQHLDKKQELSLGYYKDDNNASFIK